MPVFWDDLPGGQTLLAYLGWPSNVDLLAQAQTHAEAVALLASAWTRGRGIDLAAGTCAPVLAAVIVSAACRSLNNPSHDRRVEAGTYNAAPGIFNGWTLPELKVLNTFRRTAG